MKLKRGVAIGVGLLVLLLLVRGILHIPRGKEEALPSFVDVTQPFYPVYFGSPDGGALLPEFHQGEGTIENLLASLLAGPQSPDLVAVLPQGVAVLGYSHRGDTLYVNFSHHLVTNHPGGSTGEIITVYGIVNTLIGAQGIHKVQILVENKVLETLAGHLELKEPLTRDYELLGWSDI